MANRGNMIDVRVFGCDATAPVKECDELETCRGKGRGWGISWFTIMNRRGQLATPRCGNVAPLNQGMCWACLKAEEEQDRRLTEMEESELMTPWEEFAVLRDQDERSERAFDCRMIAKYGSMEAFENEMSEMYSLGQLSGLS